MKLVKNHWIVFFGIFFGLYVGLPFLAPVFMRIGIQSMGNAIYFIYSFFCHQLSERSYFLFGSRFSYSMAELHSAGVNISNLLALRRFIGNPEMGWKVAWSDRMVSMFASLWMFGLIWWPLRKRLPRLPLWGLILFLLPMLMDGGTHFLSDLAGIGQGFRDTNLWLAILTRHVFRPEFYAGDVFGSFNSLMRLLTGVLFGFGVVWFAFPILDESLSDDGTSVLSR